MKILQPFRSPWIYSATVLAILLGHFIVDTYSSIVAPLIGVIETEFGMKPEWAAILLGLGSVVSGLSQPVFAWVSDRTGSRVFGAIGIVLGGLGIGLIGFSSSITMVFGMFALGMVGIGMFHPIATAKIGAIAGDPDVAAQLVGYHVLDQTLTAEELIALDGQNVDSSVSLPIAVSTDDGGVILNGTSLVTVTDLVADNGIVHIIDVVLQPPTINRILDLENIEFEVSSATITAAGQETLQAAVTFFTERPNVNAVVEGHTDTDGTDEVNLELSQARAQSVVNFLVANGLEESRFTPRGFGETMPILVDGVEDKAASRRIEFVAQ